MATKNNPKNKGTAGNKKTYNGKDIEPILYDGRYAGHGKYMAAKYSKTTEMIFDENGKPMNWDAFPSSK